jgi:Predicted transmembrane protein 161AB
MYKTLGGYSWSWAAKSSEECVANLDDPIMNFDAPSDAVDDETSTDASIIKVAQNFHLSLQNLKQVFSEEVYQGLLGFATWWSCFVWFASSSFGMFYQTYFTNKT